MKHECMNDSRQKGHKACFAQFRLQNELDSLHHLSATKLLMVDADDGWCAQFEYTMMVFEGIYEGRVLRFMVKIPCEYPFKSPKVICLDRVFHPNIDENGNLCMEILRLGWKPIYGLECILANLHVIFVDISAEDALNTCAGRLLDSDYDKFVRIAKGSEDP
ncbi:NEDD8-conjugating protein ubc12 [Ordospora colligata]